MSYTIKLEQGKYLITNDNGSLTILRGGEPWPAAEELKHVKLVGALAARIEELEVAIKAVVDGTLDSNERRREDGLAGFLGLGFRVPGMNNVASWYAQLLKVLKQGE